MALNELKQEILKDFEEKFVANERFGVLDSAVIYKKENGGYYELIPKEDIEAFLSSSLDRVATDEYNKGYKDAIKHMKEAVKISKKLTKQNKFKIPTILKTHIKAHNKLVDEFFEVKKKPLINEGDDTNIADKSTL